MATLNNSQAVEDFDWDKPLEKETESQGDDALELDPTSESLDPVSESINSAPPEKKAASQELGVYSPKAGRSTYLIPSEDRQDS